MVTMSIHGDSGKADFKEVGKSINLLTYCTVLAILQLHYVEYNFLTCINNA